MSANSGHDRHPDVKAPNNAGSRAGSRGSVVNILSGLRARLRLSWRWVASVWEVSLSWRHAVWRWVSETGANAQWPMTASRFTSTRTECSNASRSSGSTASMRAIRSSLRMFPVVTSSNRRGASFSR